MKLMGHGFLADILHNVYILPKMSEIWQKWNRVFYDVYLENTACFKIKIVKKVQKWNPLSEEFQPRVIECGNRAPN